MLLVLWPGRTDSWQAFPHLRSGFFISYKLSGKERASMFKTAITLVAAMRLLPGHCNCALLKPGRPRVT